jgi:hypothetical protein
VSGGDRVFSWDAGPGGGASASAGDAFEAAAPYVRAGHRGTVREARVSLQPTAVGGGSVPVNVPTGRAWRGCLAGGEPSWAEVADETAGALAGGTP